jgi:RNA polymerase sigma-70 factor (ECF subfamily)
VLRGWARGRLPRHARGLADTDDVVQLTLVRALGRLEHIRIEGEGDFLAYLRTGVLNAIRQEIRRASNRLEDRDPGIEVADGDRSVLEQVIGRETIERYERALLTLSESQRTLVILRLEFGMSFAEIAAATGTVSDEAARKTVSRALVRLAEAMRD